MRRRWLEAVLVCAMAAVMVGAGDSSSSRFNRIGHEMVCVCGCGQILLECNHVGCPDSDRMIGELRTQMSGGGGGAEGVPGTGAAVSGLSDTGILNWFTAKYGATVLAAPIRGGFDRVAWITPIVVFFFATAGMAFLIRVWKLRSLPRMAAAGGAAVSPGDSARNALRERIRRETEY